METSFPFSIISLSPPVKMRNPSAHNIDLRTPDFCEGAGMAKYLFPTLLSLTLTNSLLVPLLETGFSSIALTMVLCQSHRPNMEKMAGRTKFSKLTIEETG